ncbi:MAG: efflux RND transporter periplasmic adaptor subunit [Nitrospira sp.]|nr:MAG: efflux RND transporter periplasmic adaptor subunit [Nitrospira sp.]
MHPPQAVRDRLKTEPVALRAVVEAVTAPGEVALDLKQVAKITSRIEGQVERIHVQLGDRVRKGQPLAAIGSLQLDQLIEEYLVGKAQADVAENSFRRTEKLRAEDIVPERKLIEERGRYLETKARYQHIREKLLNMGLSLSELTELEQGGHEESHRYTLTAPIAGTVVTQNAVRGQGVAPGQELFEVVDTSRVWVFANLPIEQARKFKEGETGTITPKGGEAVTAPLTYIAPIADETTRTIRVRFEVANQRGQLKPREYVDVTLTLSGSPTVAVQVSAVTTVDKVRGVFIERASAYAFVPIEVGREGGGWVEVRKGVKEDDRVVTEGVFDLKNVLLKAHIGSGE